MAATKTAEERVSIIIPREPGGDTMVFVALNGSAYNIPRGKLVELPKEVADVYFRSVAAEEYGMQYSDQQNALMKEVQGAP